jgi:epoxyqueuosine reductase
VVLKVLAPVSSRISKRFCRQFSQDCCPWNQKFAQPLSEPAFAPREAWRDKDARAIARDILSMDEARYRAVFKGSPMTRAKLAGLKRNAAVVLGNVGSPEDVPALAAAMEDAEPLVREHAAWALDRLGSPHRP